MIEVQSSNVAAIGFDNGLMRVRFRDGAEYEYPDITEAQHADLMASPSKGKALNALITVRAGVVLKSHRKPEVSAGGPIHVLQAEGCCAKHLNNASLAGSLDKLEPFTCPKCGTLYTPKAVGPLVNWDATVEVLIFRP